jgi:hypothetical protein
MEFARDDVKTLSISSYFLGIPEAVNPEMMGNVK